MLDAKLSEPVGYVRALHELKELMGHKNIRTTMSYLHALNNDGVGIRSPLDRL